MSRDFSCPVTIRSVDSRDVRELRHRVLWPHKSSPEECVIEVDEHPGAIHLAAFTDAKEKWGIQVSGLEGRLVGACSLFLEHCTRCPVQWSSDMDVRLRVMGTLPEVRGGGAGAALIARAAEEVRTMGRKVLWCDAREVAFGFYTKMGFVFLNDTYDIPDIGPHRTMALDVSSAAHSNF